MNLVNHGREKARRQEIIRHPWCRRHRLGSMVPLGSLLGPTTSGVVLVTGLGGSGGELGVRCFHGGKVSAFSLLALTFGYKKTLRCRPEGQSRRCDQNPSGALATETTMATMAERPRFCRSAVVRWWFMDLWKTSGLVRRVSSRISEKLCLRLLAKAAETHKILQVKEVHPGRNVFPARPDALVQLIKVFPATNGRRGTMFEPRRPSCDFMGAALGLGCGQDIGQKIVVTLAGFYLGEKSIGVDTGVGPEVLVHGAIEVIVAIFSGEGGSGLVDQAREVDKAAEPHARAAGRMLRQVRCVVLDHCDESGGGKSGGVVTGATGSAWSRGGGRSRTFGPRHGHDPVASGDDAPDGLPGYWILRERSILHALLHLKPPGRSAGCRDGFINIGGHGAGRRK